MPETLPRLQPMPARGRRRLIAALLPAAAALAARPAHPTEADARPVRVALTYALARGSLELARVEERFESADGRYRLSSEARAVGIAAAFARGQSWRRESSGRIDANGLQPAVFIDQRGQQPAQRARFEWATRRLVFDRLVAGGDEPAGEAELPEGAIDRLSFPYALGLRLPPPGDWDVSITDGRRLTAYRYRMLGAERLKLAAGDFETVHVARVRSPGESGTDVWVSRSPLPVPVRIRVTEPDGTVFDQVLLSLQPA
jgi:hypothetical protein